MVLEPTVHPHAKKTKKTANLDTEFTLFIETNSK